MLQVACGSFGSLQVFVWELIEKCGAPIEIAGAEELGGEAVAALPARARSMRF